MASRFGKSPTGGFDYNHGPQATSFSAMNNFGASHTHSTWTKDERPSTGADVHTRPTAMRDTSYLTWRLGDEELRSILYFVQEEVDDWHFRACPKIAVSGRQLTFTRRTVEKGSFDEAPFESTARSVADEQMRYRVDLQRWHRKADFINEILMHPVIGGEELEMRIQQLADMWITTLKLEVKASFSTTERWWIKQQFSEGRAWRTAADAMRDEVRDFGLYAKSETAHQDIIDRMLAQFRRQDIVPEYMIIPLGARTYIAKNNYLKEESRSGPGALQRTIALGTMNLDYRGVKVFENSEHFYQTNLRDTRFLESPTSIGQYYVVNGAAYDHVRENYNTDKFYSIKVFSADDDDFVTLSLERSIKYCGIFDANGKLSQRFKRITDNLDQICKETGLPMPADGKDISPFMHTVTNTGRGGGTKRVPLDYWGQMGLGYFPNTRLKALGEIAKCSLMSKHADNAADIAAMNKMINNMDVLTCPAINATNLSDALTQITLNWYMAVADYNVRLKTANGTGVTAGVTDAVKVPAVLGKNEYGFACPRLPEVRTVGNAEYVQHPDPASGLYYRTQRTAAANANSPGFDLVLTNNGQNRPAATPAPSHPLGFGSIESQKYLAYLLNNGLLSQYATPGTAYYKGLMADCEIAKNGIAAAQRIMRDVRKMVAKDNKLADPTYLSAYLRKGNNDDSWNALFTNVFDSARSCASVKCKSSIPVVSAGANVAATPDARAASTGIAVRDYLDKIRDVAQRLNNGTPLVQNAETKYPANLNLPLSNGNGSMLPTGYTNGALDTGSVFTIALRIAVPTRNPLMNLLSDGDRNEADEADYQAIMDALSAASKAFGASPALADYNASVGAELQATNSLQFLEKMSNMVNDSVQGRQLAAVQKAEVKYARTSRMIQRFVGLLLTQGENAGKMKAEELQAIVEGEFVALSNATETDVLLLNDLGTVQANAQPNQQTSRNKGRARSEISNWVSTGLTIDGAKFNQAARILPSNPQPNEDIVVDWASFGIRPESEVELGSPITRVDTRQLVLRNNLANQAATAAVSMELKRAFEQARPLNPHKGHYLSTHMVSAREDLMVRPNDYQKAFRYYKPNGVSTAVIPAHPPTHQYSGNHMTPTSSKHLVNAKRGDLDPSLGGPLVKPVGELVGGVYAYSLQMSKSFLSRLNFIQEFITDPIEKACATIWCYNPVEDQAVQTSRSCNIPLAMNFIYFCPFITMNMGWALMFASECGNVAYNFDQTAMTFNGSRGVWELVVTSFAKAFITDERKFDFVANLFFMGYRFGMNPSQCFNPLRAEREFGGGRNINAKKSSFVVAIGGACDVNLPSPCNVAGRHDPFGFKKLVSKSINGKKPHYDNAYYANGCLWQFSKLHGHGGGFATFLGAVSSTRQNSVCYPGYWLAYNHRKGDYSIEHLAQGHLPHRLYSGCRAVFEGDAKFDHMRLNTPITRQ